METAQEILTMYMNGSNGFFADAREQKIILAAMEVYAKVVAKNLHKPLVMGRSEQLKSFYQFLENRGLIDTNRDCSDEWVKEYEKTL